MKNTVEKPRYHVSLVHDFFVQWGGAEVVLDALTQAFPTNTVYASIDFPEIRHEPIDKIEVKTTFIQKFPFVRTQLREIYKFLFPLAFERLTFPKNTSLIISDTTSFAKFIIPPVGTKHIAYIHTPPRFLWNMPPSKRVRANTFLRFWWNVLLGSSFKISDYLHARKAHLLISNSNAVRIRVKKYYRRDSLVVNPPVYIKKFSEALQGKEIKVEKAFLAFGRIELYKNFHTLVNIWPKGYKLTIAGVGSLENEIKAAAAKNSDITFINRYVADNEKPEFFASHSGFLYPNVEDFGIMMPEAICVGTPAISFREGGGGDIITHKKNGFLLEELTTESLKEALDWCLSVQRTGEQRKTYYESMLKYDISSFINTMREIAAKYKT